MAKGSVAALATSSARSVLLVSSLGLPSQPEWPLGAAWYTKSKQDHARPEVYRFDVSETTTRILVWAVLAHAAAQVSACTSNGRGTIDARPLGDGSSCVYGSNTYAPEETFSVGCRTCSCLSTGEVACSGGLCLADSGPGEPAQQDALPGDACAGSAEGCLYSGGVLAAGESRVDGCTTYACAAGGILTCSAEACVALDAGVSAECSLPTPIVFGYEGGLEATSRITLDASGTVTAWLSTGPCSSRLPPCGTGCAITVATIARDLADPDVQAAFAADSGAVYGVSLVSQDVADFLITRSDGRTIAVGAPCCRFPELTCLPIPQAVQILVNDLKSLMASITECSS